MPSPLKVFTRACLSARSRRIGQSISRWGLAFLAAFLVPSLLTAQVEDVTPPTIIMPVTGSYTTASIPITIQFVDSSLIVQQTMVETINGANVTSGFSWSQVHHCPQMTCGWTVTSSGTIHLVPGSNTFHVEICDNEANCGAKDGHYTYTPPPPPQELSVTPTYESLEAERSLGYVEMFTITNGSTLSNIYTLTRTCTAAVIASGCTPATESRTIAGGLSDTASIAFTATASAGATGQLKLVVKLSTDATVHDSGTVDVKVIAIQTPGVVVANLNPGESVERGLCLTVSLHSGAYECGDLRLDYGFPTVRTMEKDRAPTLIYSIQLAHPIERVAAEITLPNDGRHPDSVTAKLLVTRGGSQVQVDAEKWAGSDWSLGSVRRVMLSYDAIGDSTGLYQYTIQVGRWYGATLESNSVASDLVVVNRSTSPFGAGWWLAGLERIIPLGSNKWLWIGGDGSTRVFSPSGTNLWLGNNVDRRERLEYDGTYYCRRLPHRACVLFNASGQHVQTRNRLGEVLATLDRTNFVYSGNLLTSIQLPVPSGTLSYAFAYDTVSGKPRLLRVTAPPAGSVARVTTATITSGQLLSLKYNAHPTVQFAYDGTLTNRILSVTDPRGGIEKYSFGALNTLASAKLGLSALATDTSRYTFSPVEIKGIGGTGNHAWTHQLAYTKYDGPRTDVGDSTLFWLDRFGAPAKIRDAIGNETVMTRADPNYPALVTQLRLANGRTSTATYDTVGRVLTSTAINPLGDGVNATTTNTWNMKFDFVATTTSPTGLLTTFGYDTLTGNRLWQYPGTDPVRKVLFQYNNTLLQLSSTQLPGYTSANRDSVLYGGLGNVVAGRSPLGYVDSLYENGIGQDTLAVAPIGRTLTDTSRVRTHTWFDDRGLDTASVANGSGVESRTVRKHFDENANADSVITTVSPDINLIGKSSHAFVFDAADRVLTEKLGPNETHVFAYDLAGNQTNGGARGGNNVTNSYNAMNQLVKRVATGTSTFTYDAVGEMTTANNANARISRTYYPGGGLRADTLRTATVTLSDSDFTKHVYGIGYGYDLDGRRLWMNRPIQISGGDSTAYGYDTATGQLALVIDPASNRFTFAYDLAGRLIQQVFRSQQPDSSIKLTSYDAASNRTRYSLDTATYDARGKMYPLGDSLRYSPLGELAYREAAAGGTIETYTPDALGNVYHTDLSGAFIDHEKVTTSYFYPITGELVRQQSPHGAATDTTNSAYGTDGVLLSTDIESYAGFYDASQNRYEHRRTTSQYDAQDQLISTQFVLDTFPRPTSPQYQDYYSTEEYRYDALNRRIWMRNVRGVGCTQHDKASGCRSNIRRTIWDGSEILAEIQVPGDTTFLSQESDSYVSAPYYGTVTYTHGVGIDAPLALYKGSTMVVPEQDLSNRFIGGDCHPTACGSLEIFWPESEGSAYSILGIQPNGPPSWYGSVIERQQDASGYQYKRNRYYDPQTGRFTQEDPIGLAGGLNVYGFANGDPIDFSDPFGLSCAVYGNCTQSDIGGTQSLTRQQFIGEVRQALSTISVSITGGAGPFTTQAEFRFNGTWDMEFGSIVSTSAIGASAAIKYNVQDAPKNSVSVDLSKQVGKVGPLKVNVVGSGAISSTGKAVVTSVGVEAGASVDVTRGTGHDLPFGASVSASDLITCIGTNCH